jgi:hypothetical protein
MQDQNRYTRPTENQIYLPGPLAPPDIRRPKRNITARSYSCTTCNDVIYINHSPTTTHYEQETSHQVRNTGCSKKNAIQYTQKQSFYKLQRPRYVILFISQHKFVPLCLTFPRPCKIYIKSHYFV